MMLLKITLPLTLVVTLLYLSSVDSINIGNFLRDTKSRIVNGIRDGIINKSIGMAAFNGTMAKIQSRYDEALERGELEGKDQAEQLSFYYKIVIEEIKELKKEVLPDDGEKLDAKIEEMANECKECSDDARDKMMQDLTADQDEEDIDDIKNELDDNEQMKKILQLEAEMGWSIDPETKQALKMRTLNLLSELVQNEVKGLVLVLIKAYFVDSTPPGAVAAVVGAFNTGLKTKLGEYLMNSVMDIFTNFFKKQAASAVVA